MKKVIPFITILLLLNGCKYPDGPLISTKSKLDRIIGDWNLDEFIVDGIDSTFQMNCDSCDYFISFSIDSSNTKVFDCNYIFHAKYRNLDGQWDLMDHKEYISHWAVVDLDSTGKPVIPYYDPLFRGNLTIDKWRILKLTSNKIWLDCDFNNSSYQIRLKK